MLNYSIKIIQRIILFAFILLLTFNMAGSKRNTITIQYMLEVPNLQFVETRYYFDGQWRIGSRLREKDDELLDVGKVYTDSITNNKKTCLDNFDLSTFQVEVFLMDSTSRNTYAHSNLLSIPVEYGKSYTVIIGGDPETGLNLRLK